MFPPQLVPKLALASLVILGCTACAAISGGTTTIKPSPMNSYSADPDSEIGSRNNPVALGKSVVVNDWKTVPSEFNMIKFIDGVPLYEVKVPLINNLFVHIILL